MKMKFDKSKAFFSIFYSLGQITLGFLFHPYQTMQMVIEDRVYSWMAVLPVGALLGVILIWRRIIVPFVRLFFSCGQSSFALCGVLPFLSHFVILYSLLWQILLLYLAIRFFLLSRK
jgi:hypothetical protein